MEEDREREIEKDEIHEIKSHSKVFTLWCDNLSFAG